MIYEYKKLIMWILREIAWNETVQMTHRERGEHLRSVIRSALGKIEMIERGIDTDMDDIPF